MGEGDGFGFGGGFSIVLLRIRGVFAASEEGDDVDHVDSGVVRRCRLGAMGFGRLARRVCVSRCG